MVKPEIIEQTPINLSLLKEELGKIKKRDGELNYRTNKTEEYVNSLNPLSPTKAKELCKALEKLDIPRVKSTHIHKFIDLMPISVEDAKVILQGQAITVNNDNLKKIVDVIDKYR